MNDKPLAWMTERRHKSLISGIKQNITTDLADIKRIILLGYYLEMNSS